MFCVNAMIQNDDIARGWEQRNSQMNGVLDHDSALLRLYWATDNLD